MSRCATSRCRDAGLFRGHQENVHLAVRQDDQALTSTRSPARGAGRPESRRGGRLPLHATGVGKVLLAHAPDAVPPRSYSLRPWAVHPAHDHRARTARPCPRRRPGHQDHRRVRGTDHPAPVGGCPHPGRVGAVVAALDDRPAHHRRAPGRLAPAVRAAAFSITRSLRDRRVRAE
ncbi:hypothetical protein HBB16_12860 [Pseudonocardia sp. MCCB 268]|nr:hypothetical protein [Pseudonocardia cytotoxica]